MSDVNFYGVLQMPFELAMGDELSRRQFYSVVQEAVKRLHTLEQPAQEPVAWMSEGGIFTRTKEHAEIWSNNGGKVTPVYTHPAPSWQGLSDDEIVWLCPPFYDEDNLIANEFGFARAIEQALKEKNT